VLRYLDATFVEQAGTVTLIGPPGVGKTTPPEYPYRHYGRPR
jgi:flagellar biosynthesis GTPase FlhF